MVKIAIARKIERNKNSKTDKFYYYTINTLGQWIIEILYKSQNIAIN